MKSIAVRVLAVSILVGIAVTTRAQDVPGDLAIPGMSCETVQNCGARTQSDACIGLSPGASCTFCSASQVARFCVIGGVECKTSGGNPPCGSRVQGNCRNGLCTGSIVLGDCSLLGCTS